MSTPVTELLVKYPGGCYRGSGSRYEVRIPHDDARTKSFGFAKYGGEAAAKAAAYEYWHSKCEELDLVVRITTSGQPETMGKYLAGLLDGDGCVAIYNSSALVSIRQSCDEETPEVIARMQGIYGGVIHIQPPTETTRTQHCLTFNALNCLPILHDIAPHMIMKKGQAQLVYDWLLDVDGRSKATTMAIENQLRAMKLKPAYLALPVEVSQLSDEYITGLFDAEGMVRIQSVASISLQFTQKQSYRLLECIATYFCMFGVWTPDRGSVTFSGEGGHDIAIRMLPWSIVKKSQLEAAISLRKTCTTHFLHRTTKQLEEAALTREFITVEKHR